MSNEFEKLIKKIKAYHPSDDLSMIERAFEVANVAHKGQLRKSGEPYIIHPLEVAHNLADLELDIESITAGLLHDVVEDTDITLEDIEQQFNKEVALLVDGVTKLSKIKYLSNNKEMQKEEMQAENYRKMFIAMAQDIRVVLIKLADRLHNMQTLKYMAPHKQKEKAEETLDIYAPIAHRLGICKLKSELEDLSLRYINPEAYYKLAEEIAIKRQERVDMTNEIVLNVKAELDKVSIKANVAGRPKHFFSIYKKIVNQNKNLDQIYDLFAVRVIVDSVKDCYGVLGVAHDIFTPIPGRFKDFIAMPKTNMYQSLHTTLMGHNGMPFEMQIRTKEMHRTAEYGIAAHWKYKSGNIKGIYHDKSEEKLAWLRQILEWQKDMSDNLEFMAAIKVDFDVYNDQVYVFSPKGELFTIPKGATTIDFAYYIHSGIGDKMTGAKVNDKIVNVDYELNNGDQIEILTSNNKIGPSRDWLSVVKTTQARNKINQWFRKQLKHEDILKGKELLEIAAKHRGYKLSNLLDNENISNLYTRYGLKDWNAIYASIGYGTIKETQIIQRLIDEYTKENPKTDQDILQEYNAKVQHTNEYIKSKSGIIIDGTGDIALRLSKCCNPLPGDEIVGYVTRGRGVSIHKCNCPNIENMKDDEKIRLSKAYWQKDDLKEVTFFTQIQVICNERIGVMVDVSKVFQDMRLNIRAFNARTTKNNEVIFN